MLRPRSAVSVCAAAALLCAACIRPSELPQKWDLGQEGRILEWEDRRSLGEGQLVRLASGAMGVDLRLRALRALARIQDPATLDTLLAGLRASDPRVRDEAAFAAGQLALSWEPLAEARRAKLEAGLLAAEATESSVAVRRTLLESLSKVATPGAVARLAERLEDRKDEVAGAAAVALGVSARRGASLREVSLEKAAALMGPERQRDARYGGAYLLALAARAEALEPLRRCLMDVEPEVQALCAKGVGEVGGPDDAQALGRLLEAGTPRVAAEAARSLAKLASRCSGPCAPLETLRALESHAGRVAQGASAWAHPLLAVAQYGLPRAGRPVLESLRRAVGEALARATLETATSDLAWLDCRLAAAMDRQTGALAEVHGCGGGKVDEARRLALGLREVAQSQSSEAGGAADAVALLGHPDARVRLAAVEAVGARPVPEAAGPVRALIGGQDLVLAGAAAATAGKLKDAQALEAVRALASRVPEVPQLAEPVAGALVALLGPEAQAPLRPWLAHPHANVRRVAAEALTKLTGQPVHASRVELPPEAFRWRPAPLRQTRLTFRTSKGDFTVELGADALLTSGNLYTLATEGFFKGLSFHRVVPDFVAQGGDPRGDGEGGPGYTVRCEMTRRRYRRGVLGMALSGKDTGGSQFFITHSPQPHLDGRYTAFGEVVAGMEVVDALMEGDTLLEVVALP